MAISKPKVLTATILDRQKITGLTWVADATCKGLRARLLENSGQLPRVAIVLSTASYRPRDHSQDGYVRGRFVGTAVWQH